MERKARAGELSAIAADEPGTVLLERAGSGGKGGRKLLFRAPARIIVATTPQQVGLALAAVDEALAQGWHVAGYVSYEAGLALEPTLAPLSPNTLDGEALLWFGCYGEPLVLKGDATGEAGPGAPVELSYSLDRAAYGEKVAEVLHRIERGETYQANLTMEVAWTVNEPAAALYERLLRVQPVPYAALLHPCAGWHVLSCSPELFFARDGNAIEMRPMKGTAEPGKDIAEARAQAAWLANDEKNRAENVMIVDLLRSDLGRVCEMGSVRVDKLFAVERHPTVLQMTSTVRGQLREGVGYAELFAALFPSGSIVGAPKIHTMRLLQGIEGRRRGVYTGAIGYMAPNGVAEFNVAIRTVTLRGSCARMGVGSGIVADSNAVAEYDECRTKTRFLTRGSEREFALLETLLWDQNSYARLEHHMRRMEESAEYFGFPFAEAWVHTALAEASLGASGRSRVRVLLDRHGQVSWTASSVEENKPEAVSLLLSAARTDPEDLLLRHKTTARALYDSAFGAASEMGYADAFFLNIRGEITEGAIHNVVLAIDGAWVTPPLACGVLPGVYRGCMLRERGVVERVVRLEELALVERMYVCNSVRGLRQVREVVEADGEGMRVIWRDRNGDAQKL